MRAVVLSVLTVGLMASSSIAFTIGTAQVQANSRKDQPAAASPKTAEQPAAAAEFDRLRSEGFDAIYNLDYKTARERFAEMTKVAPDHPAGYVYLANNLWLETLFQGRRLTTSVYTSGSFYAQSATEDKVDPKRDREFNDLIRQTIAAARARIAKDPKDVEAM